MNPPIERIVFPTKCSMTNCEEVLCKQSVLGIMPNILDVTDVILRCKKCKQVYALRMPIAAFHTFLENLPEGIGHILCDFDENNSEISSEEILSFGNEKNILEIFSEAEDYQSLGYFDLKLKEIKDNDNNHDKNYQKGYNKGYEDGHKDGCIGEYRFDDYDDDDDDDDEEDDDDDDIYM